MSTKTERLLNLFFLLLNSSRPLNRSEIKNRIEDYKSQDSEVAFERMFERDKDELRKNGIIIESKPIDILFEDDIGYVINRNSFFKTNLKLTMDQKNLLRLAINLWSQDSLKKSASSIASKIGLLPEQLDKDFDIDKERYQIYSNIVQAIVDKLETDILYISVSDKRPEWRKVSPISLRYSFNNWYVKAFDVQNAKIKTYNLDRIIDVKIGDKNQKFTDISDISDSSETKKTKIEFLQNVEDIGGIYYAKKLSEFLVEMHFFDAKSMASKLVPYASLIKNISDEDLKTEYIHELNRIKENIK